MLDRRDDARRHNALALAGWPRILHYTLRDLTREPQRVVGEVNRVLHIASEAGRRRDVTDAEA